MMTWLQGTWRCAHPSRSCMWQLFKGDETFRRWILFDLSMNAVHINALKSSNYFWIVQPRQHKTQGELRVTEHIEKAL